MKNIKLLLTLFLGVLVFVGCQKDEIDRAALTDFPPGILSVSPADASKVVLGGFDIVVHFVDGTISPLSTATATLSDADGTEIASATESLSGTADSLIIAGDTFGAVDLGVGMYQMNITVSDSKGQSTQSTSNFEITASLYTSNLDELFLAGEYNGWGSDAFELVDHNTWELKAVNLEGDPWKLKNHPNWELDDWGDSDCDGKVELGAPDTECGYTGEVNFIFNDETLEYSLVPTVDIESNLQSLYLHGNFNNFEGEDHAFIQTEDNIWALNEIALFPDNRFRFSELPFSMGKIYGDNENDGIAEEFGQNVIFSLVEGFYKITFNDATLAYSFEFVRDIPKIETLGLIGDARLEFGDFSDPDTDMVEDENEEGIYKLTIPLEVGKVKFRANDAWTLDWGGNDFPSGVGVEGGADIEVATRGLYNITFNSNTLEYNFEVASVGVIGSATPDEWASDQDMRYFGDGIYRTILGLTGGEAKFRANDDWPINWGSLEFPIGQGEQDGPNIPITQGLYMVSIDAVTGEYSFGSVTIGIIGSATPGGWETDTDMTVDMDNPAIVRGTFDLVDGAAKFRANDDPNWTFNWGGSDFPIGVGVQDGPDIPVTTGTYTVTLNVNTGEYSFE